MRRRYFRPRIFPRGRQKAVWQWKFFFIYVAAMVLLLVVLPALLAGGSAEPLAEETEQYDKAVLPSLDEEVLLVQVYLVEQGAIVEMDLEVYTAGVVAAEMPASFHTEALKAQAVAARTYALQKMLSLGGRGCASRPGADLCTDSTCCQAWDSGAAQTMAFKRLTDSSGTLTQEIIIKEISATAITTQEIKLHYYDRVTAAVAETEGLAVSYGGDYIEAVYHSTCGGITAAAAEIWGNDFPYLQAVQDPYCSHSPYYRQEIRMDLAAFLAAMGISMGDREAIPVLAGQEPLLEVSQQGASGRNTLLRLPPRHPERLLSGSEFRSLLGLPSTHFHWKTENNEIVFYTQGFGHGAGLCQYGADGMGQQGKSYQEILEHYYRGAVVQSKHLKPKPLP